MNIRNLLAATIATLALGLSVAMASTESPIPPAVRDIVVQQSHLRAMVVAGRGPFKDLTANDRDALVKTQTRVLEMLDGHGSIDELLVDEKIELFNHLESVKAAVNKATDDRQVCERTKVIGSNRYRLLCMNVSDYREQKQQAQKALTSTAP
ncbi:MAG: hypothetical protein IT473_08900 [Lysobacter sp.]|nr:hypothetical protein [Lysobacter sp.]